MALNKIKVNDTTTVNTGVVYDISKTTSQSYDTLSAALGTDGNNVPPEVREGGMTIRFVSNSDNKYVQYRLMAQTFSNDEDNWQGVDEQPTAGSDNLVKSGGVANKLTELDAEVGELGSHAFNEEKSVTHHFDIDSPTIEYHSVIIPFFSKNTPSVIVDSGSKPAPMECYLYDKEGNELAHDKKMLYEDNYRRAFVFPACENVASALIQPYASGVADVQIDLKTSGSLEERINNQAQMIEKNSASIDTTTMKLGTLKSVVESTQYNADHWFDRNSGNESRHYFEFPFFSQKTPKIVVELLSGDGALECHLYNGSAEVNVCAGANGRLALTSQNPKRTFTFESPDFNITKIKLVPYSDSVFNVRINVVDSASSIVETISDTLNLYNGQKMQFQQRLVATWDSPTYPKFVVKDFVSTERVKVYIKVDANSRLLVSLLDANDFVVGAQQIKVLTTDANLHAFIFEPCDCHKLRIEMTNFDANLDVFVKTEGLFTKMLRAGRSKNHDVNVLSIAYSGFYLDSPAHPDWHLPVFPCRNSKEHFEKCLQYGFNALKCDMQLTSDKKIFLCHDIYLNVVDNTIAEGGNTSTSSNTAISSMTLDDIMSKSFVDVAGNSFTPCDLDTYLFICKKYGMIPFITLRNQNDAEDVVSELYQRLKVYALEDVAIINLNMFGGMNNYALDKLDYPLRKCYTLDGPDTVFTIDEVDKAVKFGCEYICLYTNPTVNISTGVIRYAVNNGVKVMGCCDNSSQWDNAVKKGVVGFQVQSPEAIPSAVETLNSIAFKLSNL